MKSKEWLNRQKKDYYVKKAKSLFSYAMIKTVKIRILSFDKTYVHYFTNVEWPNLKCTILGRCGNRVTFRLGHYCIRRARGAAFDLYAFMRFYSQQRFSWGFNFVGIILSLILKLLKYKHVKLKPWTCVWFCVCP